MSVLAGSAFGATSPVRTPSETLYLAVDMKGGATLELPLLAAERAIYLAEGRVSVDGHRLNVGDMAVLSQDKAVAVQASEDTKLMILGGAPLEGERHIFWNLVSSSRERIEKAKEDWRNDRFEKVPGETEFIPLPD